MPLSVEIRKRVQDDAKAPDFWSVPKGQSVKAENWERIADHLRVLAEFQKVPWSEAQPLLVESLLKRKLIQPYKDYPKGFSAVARMQFPVWRLLGLAWINGGAPEITQVGRRFVETSSEKERRELLTMQLHRYQFSNPSAASHFSGFRTFPVLALYRLLTQTDWTLSKTEFLLFGTRVRTFQDADAVSLLIEEWRTLSTKEKGQLLNLARTIPASSHTKSEEGTTLKKVENDVNYIMKGVLGILPTLNIDESGISVPRSARKTVSSLALAASESAVYVDYKTEQDWLAAYGLVPADDRWKRPWSTVTEARAYYERIGRIDAATAEYAKEHAGRTKADIERYRSIQVLESVLEDLLEHHLDMLEKGLKLVGRQYSTAVGPIDLLAQDAAGNYVVIELKRGHSGDRVVGQIARYITWVDERLTGGKDKVRGMIVGKDFNDQYAAAVKQLPHVSSYSYDVQLAVESWASGNRPNVQ